MTIKTVSKLLLSLSVVSVASVSDDFTFAALIFCVISFIIVTLVIIYTRDASIYKFSLKLAVIAFF